ncbi:serine protease hepsin [Nematostella vectensis]|uniref:serine protease hepsin n=1 Tax=Nematostella vectensis TaxID=45351 RepID=UPI00139035CD|nr:serine protease hepsin [Nematostella vectensis]
MSRWVILVFAWVALLGGIVTGAGLRKSDKLKECGKRLISKPYSYASGGGTRKRIVGGVEAAPGAWPWQVALLMNGTQFCGGSLVNENWVVTARHCFHELWSSMDTASWTASLGEHHLVTSEGFEQFIAVERIILHPKNDLDKLLILDPGIAPPDYDLALLRLAKPAKLDEYVSPICLLPDGFEFPWAKECYITGWGKTEFEGTKPQVIREATVKLVPPEICNQVESYNGSIHVRALCAGFDQGGVDACQFDSGGPLSCSIGSRFYLTGVVSWGHECARPKKYGVYANMMRMTSWVRDTIAWYDGL